MTRTAWFLLWFRRGRRSRHGALCPEHGPALLPFLEPLEDRTLPSFAAPVPYNTAPFPRSVTVGDFDNDGRLDLVTANATPTNSVSVLLGNGDATFRPARQFATGPNPVQVVAVDVEGDGNADLVSVHNGANTVGVLRGNGDGTFAAVQTYVAGQAPLGVAAGDLNRDGKADLAVSDSGNRITLLLNNGDGSFRTGANYPTGSVPFHVAIADFNGDHIPDVLSNEYISDGVRYFEGNGNGTLQPGAFFLTRGAFGLAVADYNRDGILDVGTVGGGYYAQFSVIRGNGNGTFQQPRGFPTEGGTPVVAAADFNNDNQPDAVTLSQGSENLSVLYGYGDLTFQNAFSFRSGPALGANPSNLAVGDFNRDGFADLAVTLQNFNYVCVLQNRPAIARLRVTAGASVTAGAPVAVTLTAVDEANIPAPHYRGTVRFTSSDPAASLPADYTFTAADNGTKTFQVMFRSVGSRTLTTVDITFGPITGNATVTVNPDAAASLVVSGFPSPTMAGAAGTFTVTARDPFGNVATGYRGTVRFSSSDAQATLPSNYTFQPGDNGTRLVSATLRTVPGIGTHSITATDTTSATLSSSQTGIVVTPAPASRLALAAPASVPPDAAFPVTVTARDPFGNVAAGYRGTVRLSTSDPRVALPAEYTFIPNDQGVRTFTALLHTAGGQTLTVRDRADGALADTASVQVVIPQVFGSALDLSVAAAPRAVAAADFNFDGIPDLATANYDSDNVSVLLGLGGGTFLNAVNYPTERTPTSLAAGDFTSDGVPDLISTNQFAGSLSLLAGTGDGTFQPAIPIRVGTQPLAVAAADLNWDGRLDLATVDYFTHSLRVLLGNGDGTFRPAVAYPVDRNPWHVTVGDINNDGLHDLVAANGNLSVSVLLGNGDGSFRPAVHHAVGGAGSRSVAVGDLNGDGNTDLVTANREGRSVSVLLGLGDNTFLTAVNYGVPTDPYAVALSDLNGDSALDLAVSDDAGGVSILVGFGDGAFQTPLRYAAGRASSSLAVGDFNGDAAPDLAVGNAGTNSVTVLANLAPAMRLTLFAPPTRIAGVPFAVGVAAMNAFGGAAVGYRGTVRFTSSDGQAVLPGEYAFAAADAGMRAFTVTLRTAGSQTVTVRDIGAGMLTASAVIAVNNRSLFAPAVNYPTDLGPNGLAVGDLNNDGKSDLISANSAGTVSVLLGNGDGTFRPERRLGTGHQPRCVTLGDYNEDGNLDIMVGAVSASRILLFLGNGDGTFLPPQQGLADPDPVFLYTGDFNKDRHLDLLSVNAFSASVSLFLGNGNGTFQGPRNFDVGNFPHAAAVGDFDHNGALDLAVTNLNSATLSVLLGNGDGSFQPQRSYAAGMTPSSARAGDFNADGNPDVVLTNRNAYAVGILLGNGDGTFQPLRLFPANGFPESLAVNDFNMDGALDVATVNMGAAYTVSVLLGNGNGTFLPPLAVDVGPMPMFVTNGDLNGDGVPDRGAVALASEISEENATSWP